MIENNRPNLYNTLFSEGDEHDGGLFTINSMYDHLNFEKMSDYVDIVKYNSSLAQNNDPSLSVMHLNIRSLPSNLPHLEVLLASLAPPPDVIVLSETWLTPINKDIIIINGYYSYSIARSQNAHGGVSIYIKQNIESCLLEKFTYINDDIEICSTSIEVLNRSFIICAIYRPHSKRERVNEFRNQLCEILSKPLFKKSNTIIIGDININLLEHNNHRPTNDFINMLQTYNYIPLITRPTRFAEGNQTASPSLLDHIYVNFTYPLVAGILHHNITDHLPIFLNICIPSSNNTKQMIQFRSFTEMNQQLFSRALSNVSWEEILIKPNVNDNFKIFFETVSALYNKYFPIKKKQISQKRILNPWITSGILTSIRHKNKLYKEKKLGYVTIEQFNAYRNKFNTIIRRAKQLYYNNLFSSFKNNTKKLWQEVNKITKRANSRTTKTTIVNNSKIISDPKPVANEFNNYFTNIASSLNSKLPHSTDDPMQYLTKSHNSTMNNPRPLLVDILNIIKSLKAKPCRIDDFWVNVIKNNSRFIATPILQLFNESITQGIFPNQLKMPL